MKAVLAQAENFCVNVKPQKLCRTCIALFHTFLTVGPIQSLWVDSRIDFYDRRVLTRLATDA